MAPAGIRRSQCPAVPRTPPSVIESYVNCPLSLGQRLIIPSPSHKRRPRTFLEPLGSHTPRQSCDLPAPHPSASTGITENTVFTMDPFFGSDVRIRPFRHEMLSALGGPHKLVQYRAYLTILSPNHDIPYKSRPLDSEQVFSH